MKMPSIPLAQAKSAALRAKNWLADKAKPVIIEIPSKAERIGFALGRKTRNVVRALAS